ncbi:hypothetical protein CRUP_012961, partial [Coryphaenoides rupestris]
MSTLERERELHMDELQQLRCMSVSLHQQLRDRQQQVCVLEMDRHQLHAQTLTLQQTKDTLQGEMECLKEELERGRSQREQQRERGEELEEEGENRWRLQAETLLEELEEMSKMRRDEEAEWKLEREVWQRERECLSAELGRGEAEEVVMRSRMEEVSTRLRESEGEAATLLQTQRRSDKRAEEEGEK